MDKIGEAQATTFEVGKRHQVLHQVKAKRGRKDRHSKVCTAGGTTRDRRVRLSPNTAILFYDLQDRLGCDRPSKAIDWLMSEAKPAIHALHRPPTPTPTPTHLFSGEGQGHHHFDANSQFVTLQTTLEYSSAPREPLQSSSSIISPNFPQFQGFGFSDLDL